MLKCVHIGTQIRLGQTVLQKIGMREFRNNLAKYISSTEPVAVMRHGQTVGYREVELGFVHLWDNNGF